MYNLDLDHVIAEIKEKGAKTVLVQLPDGLKPKAKEIVDELSQYAEIYIWFSSCFGACDIPKFECDLIVQFGHNKFLREEW